MDYIYAIIKNPNTQELSMVKEHICPASNYIMSELCNFHDYAFSLSDMYSSRLNQISFNELNCYMGQQQLRKEAIDFKHASDTLRRKYGNRIVAMSHRHGGFLDINWNFNKEISFHIGTNFGYGSASFFYSIFKYKEHTLTPYSFYVKYRNSDYANVVRYTYDYRLDYKSWEILLSDCLDFYNAIVNKREYYIFSWLQKHLSEMVSGLEHLMEITEIKMEDGLPFRNHASKLATFSSDDFLIIKAKKIAFSLDFVKNISQLPVQVDPEQYINRIHALCKRFQPMLKQKIESTNQALTAKKEELVRLLESGDYPLYNKLHKKYYSKKTWYLDCNKKTMLKFLIALKNRFGISRTELKIRSANLQQLLSDISDMKSEISSLDNLLANFTKADDRMDQYFQGGEYARNFA